MELIQVEILGLSTSSSSGGAYALVLGDSDGGRRLPIIIGAFEAQAIALELEKIQPPRPMTHDLLRDLLEQVGGEVVSIVISELRDGTFYARVRFVHEGRELELDSRPSDAVALAVRVEAPIYVSDEVLLEAGLPGDEDVTSSESETGEADEVAVEDPPTGIEAVKSQLEKAIASENYEKAAQLRDEIQRLKTLES
jgi:bifunctional DNase/RNase